MRRHNRPPAEERPYIVCSSTGVESKNEESGAEHVPRTAQHDERTSVSLVCETAVGRADRRGPKGCRSPHLGDARARPGAHSRIENPGPAARRVGARRHTRSARARGPARGNSRHRDPFRLCEIRHRGSVRCGLYCAPQRSRMVPRCRALRVRVPFAPRLGVSCVPRTHDVLPRERNRGRTRSGIGTARTPEKSCHTRRGVRALNARTPEKSCPARRGVRALNRKDSPRYE